MEKWENPALASENLIDARAFFREDRVSLGGRWRFLSQSADLSAPEGWEQPDFDDKKWRRIPVPGSWETQEVCASFYRGENLPAAFSADGTLDASRNLTAFYRRSFTLSRDQGSRQIILHFARVSSCALVWVNGTYIGMAKGCSTAAEFDITAAVRPEKNVVCVQVLRYSDVTPLEPRDAWLPSGILGDVELYSLPGKAITDIQTKMSWQEDGAPLLHIALKTRNADGFTARIALMDGNQVVGYCESPIQNDCASASISCKDAKLWTAEMPNLYRVAVILWDGVAMYHTREVSVGFRKIAQENGVLTLNGQPEKLLAVNYRPLDPETGCIPNEEVIERELNAIRAHNFNAVRPIGPVPEELYDICDRVGVYLLVPEEFENVPEHLAPYAAEQNARLSAVRANHPCVLPLKEVRVLNAPSASQLKQAFGIEAPTETTDRFRNRRAPEAQIEIPGDQPLIPAYSALPENAGELVALLRSQERLCGAIFGSWQDSLFAGRTAPGAGAGFVSPNGMPRPAAREAKAILAPVTFRFENDTLTLENHSWFLSTDALTCRYRLTRDGKTVVDKPVELNAAPGGIASVAIETKYDIYKPGRYYLTAELLDKDGTTIASAQWPVAQLKHIYDENPGGTIREDSGSIFLRSQDASFVIDRTNGALEQIKLEEQAILTAPLFPVFARASAASGLRIMSEWEKLTSRKKKLKPSVFEVDHMTRTVTASFHLGSGLMQTYRLYSDGSLAVELRLRTGRTAPERLGVHLSLPAGMDRLRWFGLGPDEVIPGHQAGSFYGTHKRSVEPTHTGYQEPVYTLDITNEAGLGLHVRSEEGLRASAQRSPDGNGTELILELPSPELKPHTTYAFGFVITPMK